MSKKPFSITQEHTAIAIAENTPEMQAILGGTERWKRGSGTSLSFSKQNVSLKHISEIIRRRRLFIISNTQRQSLASKHFISI